MRSNQSSYTKTKKLNNRLVTESAPNDTLNLYPLLKNVYELSNDAIVVYDLSKRIIIDVNNKFTDTFYFTKEDVLNEPSILLNIFTDESEFFNICETLEEFDIIKDYKIVLKNKDNENLSILLSAQTQKILDKTYVVWVLRDVSYKKNIETILRTHQEQLSKEVSEQTEKLKISESALKEILYTEKLYGNMFRNAPIGIVKGTGKGKLENPNQAFADLVGYTIDELKDINWIETLTPSYWKKKEEAMARKLSPSNNVVTYNKEYIRKDGSLIPVEITTIATFEENTDVSYIAFVHSIEHKELYYQSLKDNESLVNSYFYASNTPIALSVDGVLYEANQAYFDLFKYDKHDALIGKSVLEFIDPSEHSKVESYIALRTSCDKAPENYKTVGLAKNKTKIPLEVDVTELVRGDIKFTCAFFKDLTLDQLLEEKIKDGKKIFEQLVENAVVGVSITNLNGNIIYANNAFAHICGFKTGDELISKSILSSDNCLCGWKDNTERLRMLQVIKEKGEVSNFNVDLINRNGETRHILYSAKLSDELIYGMFMDITSEKEAALLVEQSDRLKTAFLTNISHEIRTPMNGILGFTGLLKDNHLTGEEKQEYIALIEESSERMLHTINDIIDMSRIDAGEVNFNFSNINLTDQIAHLYNVFYDEASEKNIEFCCQNLGDEEALIINSDKTKLNFIFTSLIKNAIKYTNEGRVDFGCTIENIEGQKSLKFYVKDTGVGIPSEKQELIFERFMQGDIRPNRDYDGSGLGLSIAKAYAEMLEGRIWVKSEEGKGATFYVCIPLEYNVKSINQLDVIYSNIYEEEKLENLKILIVDDELLVRKYLGLVLKPVTQEILYAESGQEAIESYMANPDIDLILMDLRLPEMNGFEATQIIRKLNKEVQIIMQSAFMEIGEKDEAISAGANDFITKPIDKNKLMRIIKSSFKKKNVNTKTGI